MLTITLNILRWILFLPCLYVFEEISRQAIYLILLCFMNSGDAKFTLSNAYIPFVFFYPVIAALIVPQKKVLIARIQWVGLFMYSIFYIVLYALPLFNPVMLLAYKLPNIYGPPYVGLIINICRYILGLSFASAGYLYSKKMFGGKTFKLSAFDTPSVALAYVGIPVLMLLLAAFHFYTVFTIYKLFNLVAAFLSFGIVLIAEVLTFSTLITHEGLNSSYCFLAVQIVGFCIVAIIPIILGVKSIKNDELT